MDEGNVRSNGSTRPPNVRIEGCDSCANVRLDGCDSLRGLTFLTTQICGLAANKVPN
jgi:hypothetical protein